MKKFVTILLVVVFSLPGFSRANDGVKSSLFLYSSSLGYGFYSIHSSKSELFSIQKCSLVQAVSGSSQKLVAKDCRPVRSGFLDIRGAEWCSQNSEVGSYFDGQFESRLETKISTHQRSELFRNILVGGAFGAMGIAGLIRDSKRPSPILGFWGRVVFSVGVLMAVAVTVSDNMPELEVSVNKYAKAEDLTTREDYVKRLMEFVEESLAEALTETSKRYGCTMET